MVIGRGGTDGPDDGGPHPATGWVVQDCVFAQANGPGAGFTGRGLVVRGCTFRDNGQLGFTAYRCHDALLTDCRIEGNNVKGYSTGWEAGGNKVVLSRGFVFDRCQVTNNHGPGIWFDIGNEGCTVRHCQIEDNDGIGLYYEISFGLHAHDNRLVNNANVGQNPPWHYWGDGGITLASSPDCLIEGNTILQNRQGVVIKEQDRDTEPYRRSARSGSNAYAQPQHHRARQRHRLERAVQPGPAYDTRFFGPHPSGNDRADPPTGDPQARASLVSPPTA